MKKKTHEEFIKECNDKNLLKYYKILSKYKTNNTTIKVKHLKCGNEFEILPLTFLRKNKSIEKGIDSCKKCSKTKLKTHKEFVKECKDKYNNEYSIIGKYKNDCTKIKIRHNCKKCNNHIFETTPSNFLQNHKCPECYGTKLKDTKDYKEEINLLFNNEFTLLSEYKTNHDYVTIRHNCEKCNNYIWNVRPYNFSTGKKIGRCPMCALIDKESNGIKISNNYFNNNKINFSIEKRYKNCKFHYTLPFDYIIENNYLYEYDGEQHFIFTNWYKSQKEFGERKIKDRIKDNYCLQNNLTLLRIAYTQENNISNILNDFLENNDLSKYNDIMLIKDGKIIISNGIYSELVTLEILNETPNIAKKLIEESKNGKLEDND